MPWPRSVPGHLCVCLYFSFGNSSHCEIRETLGSKSWVLSSFVVVYLSLKKEGPLSATWECCWSTGCCVGVWFSRSFLCPAKVLCLSFVPQGSEAWFWRTLFHSQLMGKFLLHPLLVLPWFCLSVVWLISCLSEPMGKQSVSFLSLGWFTDPLTSFCLPPEPSLTVPMAEPIQNFSELLWASWPLAVPFLSSYSEFRATLTKFLGRRALNTGLRYIWERRTFSFCYVGSVTCILSMFVSLRFLFVWGSCVII